jgi:hypothetical protein
MNQHSGENDSALARAEAEARRMLDLLRAERPDADAIKARWYDLGLAVREAIKELRRADAGREA